MADDLVTHVALARYYIWQALLGRAGPIPPELLAQVAMATAGEVPAFADPVVRVEWHIERIITVARMMLADQGDDEGDAAPLGSAVTLVRLLEAAKIPSLVYPTDSPRLVHLAPGGSACETPLPAVCCACGLYLLIGETP